MEISIRGTPKHAKKKAIRYAANFFADQLLSKRLSSSLSLKISFDPEETKQELIESEFGACGYTYDEEYGNPKEFEIFIHNNLDMADLYHTLAHEMKHLEQYARGKLHCYLKETDTVRWMNKAYKLIKDVQSKKYKNQPWEKEATQAEKDLVDALHQHVNEKMKDKNWRVK